MNSTTHVDKVVHGNVLEVVLHGKLDIEDYKKLVPDIDAMIREHAKIRILVTMHGFQGWDADALWEDMKWNVRHFNQIERLAMLGEKTWHHCG